MPIFISRFSPERSLVGNFLSARSRRDRQEAEPAQTGKNSSSGAGRAVDQPRDRLELSERQTAPPSAEQTRASSTAQPASTSRAPEAADTGGAQGANSQTSQTSGSLTVAEQVRLRRVEAQVTEVSVQATAVQDTERIPLALRLGQLLSGDDAASENAAAEAGGADGGILVIRQENRSAALSATVERLEAFLTRLDGLAGQEAAEAEPEEGEAAPEAEAQAAPAPSGVPAPDAEEAAPEGALAQNAQVQPLPREIQEQELQRDLQTIATGLRSDAAIESQRNVEAMARNAQQVAARNQRQEIRENQTQIRSLQTERRSLQQEMQATDQAIRQLQNRNSRLQNSARPQPNPGTSLDILAQ